MKIAKLEELSSFFNNTEEIDLNDAVVKYEQAVKLAMEIKKELSGIELKIKEIKAAYEDKDEDES